LFYAGEYTRAAALFDEVGGTYRRYLPPADPWVLDCAFHAGHAYAETGKPAQALTQLRYYIQHAAPGQDGSETDKIIESRYVVAQLLATGGEPDAALAELSALRSQLASAFGEGCTQVRNIDKQLGKLAAIPSRSASRPRPGNRPA
jgi:hypothetical protein